MGTGTWYGPGVSRLLFVPHFNRGTETVRLRRVDVDEEAIVVHVPDIAGVVRSRSPVWFITTIQLANTISRRSLRPIPISFVHGLGGNKDLSSNSVHSDFFKIISYIRDSIIQERSALSCDCGSGVGCAGTKCSSFSHRIQRQIGVITIQMLYLPGNRRICCKINTSLAQGELIGIKRIRETRIELSCYTIRTNVTILNFSGNTIYTHIDISDLTGDVTNAHICVTHTGNRRYQWSVLTCQE